MLPRKVWVHHLCNDPSPGSRVLPDAPFASLSPNWSSPASSIPPHRSCAQVHIHLGSLCRNFSNSPPPSRAACRGQATKSDTPVQTPGDTHGRYIKEQTSVCSALPASLCHVSLFAAELGQEVGLVLGDRSLPSPVP